MELLLLLFFYIIIGIPYYPIFSELFKANNRILGLVYPAFLGFVFFTLFQLIAGFFHLPVAGPSSMILKLSIIVLPFFSFCIPRHRDQLRELFKSSRHSFKWLDLLIFFLTLMIALSLYFVINQNHYLGYDEFRVWLVNAREIFTSGYLRFDVKVMDDHKLYNSFFALAISNIYDFAGGIYETKAVYITQLSALLYILFLWERLMVFAQDKRLFILVSAFLIVLSFNNTFIKLLYINYIEVQLAFFFFMSMFLAFRKSESVASWLQGLFLLLICCYIIGSSKQAANNGAHNFLLPIAFLYIVYNYFYQRELLKSVFENLRSHWFKLILPSVFFIVLFAGHIKYFSHLKSFNETERIVAEKLAYENEEASSIMRHTHKILWPFKTIAKKAGKLKYSKLDELIDTFAATFTLVIILLMFFLFSAKHTASSIFTAWSIFSLMVFVILGYALKDKDVSNFSFHRYLTHGFFAIPLIYCFAEEHTKEQFFKFSNYFFSCTIVLLLFVLQLNQNILKDIDWGKPFHEGSLAYSDNFNKYTNAQFDRFLISKIVADKNVIFVDGSFADGQNSEIYTQYLMQENSVGGELKELESAINRGVLEHVDHEYLVIFDFHEDFAEKLNFIDSIPSSADFAVFEKNSDNSYSYIPIN